MLIISVEVMKTIDERKRCDTRCVVMRWSISEVKLRQWKMLIIIVSDSENNRWKGPAKKEKNQGGGHKPYWKELNDFVVHLS